MIAIPQLMVTWLNSDANIAATTEGRISTILQPDAGFPAIVIGPVGGGPTTTPSRNVDAYERWTVPIYCLAGRRGSELDDLPDNVAAWSLAQQVSRLLATLDTTHFVDNSAEIVAARVLSVTQSVDPGNFARVLINAQIQIWNRQQ